MGQIFSKADAYLANATAASLVRDMKLNLMPIFILLTFVLAGPSSYGKTQAKYNHVGKVEYHPPQTRDLLAGRTDLFYDGDYICTPGDEHHAPDCRKNWWVIDAQGYKTITLDDGTQILVFDNNIDLDNVFNRLPIPNCRPPCSSTFRYRLRKIKKDWMKFQEIEIEGIGKGYYQPLEGTAPQDQHCLALAPERQADCLAGK